MRDGNRSECLCGYCRYAASDWATVGAHVYRDTPGYYDTLRPSMQISDWTYSAVRDAEYDTAAPPAWGKPYCKQWWEDSSIGLREKLINEADATSAGFSGLVVAVVPALASEKQNDAVARPCSPTHRRAGRTMTSWQINPAALGW